MRKKPVSLLLIALLYFFIFDSKGKIGAGFLILYIGNTEGNFYWYYIWSILTTEVIIKGSEGMRLPKKDIK